MGNCAGSQRLPVGAKKQKQSFSTGDQEHPVEERVTFTNVRAWFISCAEDQSKYSFCEAMLLAQHAKNYDLEHSVCLLCFSVEEDNAAHMHEIANRLAACSISKDLAACYHSISLNSAVCDAINTFEHMGVKLDHSSWYTKLGKLYEDVDTEKCINYYVCAIDAAISIRSGKDKARCLSETVNAFAAFQHSVPFVDFMCNRCHAVLQHDDECEAQNACFDLTKEQIDCEMYTIRC
jgi:hypothetical protein